MYIILCIVLCFITSGLPHTYHTGKNCPIVEPMQGFEMSKVSIILSIVLFIQFYSGYLI